MPVRRVRSPVSGAKRPARSNLETTDSLPMVEIALSGVEGDDWVTETFRTQGASFRLLACRPSDRGRRRLVRLFEVEADGTGIGPLVFRLRTRLAARDLAVANLGRDRALLRVSVPLPAICSAAFDRGDFCVSCPFLDTTAPEGLTTWNVLVPQIDDARRSSGGVCSFREPPPVSRPRGRLPPALGTYGTSRKGRETWLRTRLFRLSAQGVSLCRRRSARCRPFYSARAPSKGHDQIGRPAIPPRADRGPTLLGRSLRGPQRPPPRKLLATSAPGFRSADGPTRAEARRRVWVLPRPRVDMETAACELRVTA